MTTATSLIRMVILVLSLAMVVGCSDKSGFTGSADGSNSTSNTDPDAGLPDTGTSDTAPPFDDIDGGNTSDIETPDLQEDYDGTLDGASTDNDVLDTPETPFLQVTPLGPQRGQEIVIESLPEGQRIHDYHQQVGNLNLDRYEMCAFNGDVSLAEVRVEMNGAFQEIPVTLELVGQEAAKTVIPGAPEDQEVVLSLEDPVVVVAGGCEIFRVNTQLPLPLGSVTWVSPQIVGVVALNAGLPIDVFVSWFENFISRTYFQEPEPEAATITVTALETIVPDFVERSEEEAFTQLIADPDLAEGVVELSRFKICTDSEAPISDVIVGFDHEGPFNIFVQTRVGSIEIGHGPVTSEQEEPPQLSLLPEPLPLLPGEEGCKLVHVETPLPFSGAEVQWGHSITPRIEAVVVDFEQITVNYVAVNSAPLDAPPVRSIRTVFSETERLPEAELIIRRVPLGPETGVELLSNDEVRLIEDVNALESDELRFAEFEGIVSGGPVTITSSTFKFDGSFNLPVTVSVRDEVFTSDIHGGLEVTILETNVELQAGDRVRFLATTSLPFMEESYTSSVRASLSSVEVSDPERITVHYVDERRNEPPLLGPWTMFEQENSLIIYNQRQLGERIQVSNREEHIGVADFRLYADRTGRGAVTGSRFCVRGDLGTNFEGEPNFGIFDFMASVVDGPFGDWTNLDLSNRRALLQVGDCFVWDLFMPEHLDWGGYLNLEVNLASVPEGAQEVTLEVTDIFTLDPETVVEGEDWLNNYVRRPISEEDPLPWSTVEFIETEAIDPFLGIYYEHPFDLDDSTFFLWDRTYQNCGDEEEARQSCPLAQIRGNILGASDQRYIANIQRAEIAIWWDNWSDPLDVRVIFYRDYDWQRDPAHIEMSVTLQPGELTTVSAELDWNLNRFNDHEFRVLVLLDEEALGLDEDGNVLLPQIMADASFPPELRVDVIEVVATSQEHGDLDTWISAPIEPGRGDWRFRSLPYAGPDLLFASPELWRLSHLEGFPIEVAALPEDAPPEAYEDILVWSARFAAKYGGVTTCRYVFRHNSAKEEPPADTFALAVGGNQLAGLSHWDVDHVIFQLTPEQCGHIDKQSWRDAEVIMRGPRSATAGDHPIQMELIELEAFAAPRSWQIWEDEPVTLALREELIGGGESYITFLGDDQSATIRGPQVIITPIE